MLKRKYINPEELPDWSSVFSQVIEVENHNLRLIYVSGQVGVDRNKNIVGDGSLKTQTEQSFKNLQTALNSVGAGIQDVVKLNIYVVNYKREDSSIIGEAINKFFAKGKLPVLSLIGVQSLAVDAFLIEIDAEAII